jgi:redox-sensing transcriptional repressor
MRMNKNKVPKSVLERLPIYLHYLKTLSADECKTISSANIARGLGLGEVQVRKDLALVCGTGKPKIGYSYQNLVDHLEDALGCKMKINVVIVGAGKLGKAFLSYDCFTEYGFDIMAAFDIDEERTGELSNGKKIFTIDKLKEFCQNENVKIGIITVPEGSAQSACDLLVNCGVKAIWNFSPTRLVHTSDVKVKNENMASSLAVLSAELRVK